jgi:hypothetical protein
MILKYIHPYIQVNIYDNSFIYEEASGGNTLLLMPYFSSKGESNKLVYYNNKANFLIDNGEPNFKKYGQAQYQAYNWLVGKGRLYGCRLMPDDATYANLILNVKTKAEDLPAYKKNSDGEFVLDRNGNRIPLVDESDPLNPVEVTVPGVRIKLEYVSLEGLTNIASNDILVAKLNTLNSNSPTDDEGYKNHYILGFVMNGKGKYGNKRSVYISPDYSLENTYDFRVYNIIFQDKSDTGVMSVPTNGGPFQFSLFPEAMSLARYSMFFENIVSSYTDGTTPFFSETNYDNLMTDILAATAVNDEDTLDAQTVDFLFGIDKNKQAYENIVIDSSSVNISAESGVFFLAGSDGSIDPNGQHYRRDDEGEIIYDSNDNPVMDDNTPAYVRDTMDDLLDNFYIGLIDPNIYNTTIYEFDVAMDANFSNGTKYNIVDFCKDRGDTFCYIDSGVQASVEATLNWRKYSFQTNHYICSIQGQAFKVEDSFTDTTIEVTPCYHLSRMIPEADERYGIQLPLAGHRRGIIEGYKSINWIPDEDEKEKLWTARINYIEEDINYIVRMSQLTSQFMESALARENNVRVLLKMVRSAKKACKMYYHEQALASNLTALQNDITNTLRTWIDNKALESLNVNVSQTKYEKQRRIVHIYISCVFTSTFERFVIDFSINAE